MIVATARHVRMLASVADRDRAILVLQASFAEGRLSCEEFDSRIGQALLSRDFPDLAELIGDLPVGPLGRLPAHRATPQPAETRVSKLRRALHGSVSRRRSSPGIHQGYQRAPKF